MATEAQRTPAMVFGRKVYVLGTCTRAAHEVGAGELVFRGGEWLDVVMVEDGRTGTRAAVRLTVQRKRHTRKPRMLVLPASELLTVATGWA